MRLLIKAFSCKELINCLSSTRSRGKGESNHVDSAELFTGTLFYVRNFCKAKVRKGFDDKIDYIIFNVGVKMKRDY